jgi:hypothetical protein
MHMADLPQIDATAVFPPLTANEARVLQLLSSEPGYEFGVDEVAERTGLGPERAELALGSLGSRRPPLVAASESNRLTRTWPPVRYSAAKTRL